MEGEKDSDHKSKDPPGQASSEGINNFVAKVETCHGINTTGRTPQQIAEHPPRYPNGNVWPLLI